MIEWIMQMDERLFLAINRYCDTGLNYAFGWTTHLIAAYFLLPLTYLYMRIWEKKDLGRKFAIAAASTLAGGAAAQLLKVLVDRDRPLTFFYDRLAAGTVEVKSLFGIYLYDSFPSAHTAFAFGAAAGLSRLYSRYTLAFIAGAFLLSMTRIFVGAHFPSDVIGGAVLGWLAGQGAGAIVARRSERVGAAS